MADNRKKKRVPKCLKKIIIVVFALLFCGWTLYNARYTEHFFEASATSCITIAVAVIVSYYFVQRKGDVRKQKDIILDLIFNLQRQIASEEMIDFSKQESEEIMMRNRAINNRLAVLKGVSDQFEIVGEVSFVLEKFKEYEELIGNHINDLQHLIDAKKDLQRPLGLIDVKLTELALKLYQ